MNAIFTLLLIIFLAFSGYHLSFRRLNLPLFAREFYLTGTEFLFLGLVLSSRFFGIIDAQTCKELAPLSTLALGWIGMLYGFQFEVSRLQKFPLEYFVAANFQGIFTLILVLSGLFLIESFLPLFNTLLPFIVIGATSACSSQTGLALMTPAAVARRAKPLKLLRYISSTDGLIALVVFGISFGFRTPPTILEEYKLIPYKLIPYKLIPWAGEFIIGFIISLALSIGILILFMLLLSWRLPESQLILVVIGMIIFASGTASLFNFSPLIINFFIGCWLVNFPVEKERIYRILIPAEKPAYILTLIFLGTVWRFDLTIAGFAIFYCLFRFLGKSLSGFLISRVVKEPTAFINRLGFGLLEQGGIVMAMLLDFSQNFPGDMSQNVVSIVLIAVIINEFISPSFLNRLLIVNRKS